MIVKYMNQSLYAFAFILFLLIAAHEAPAASNNKPLTAMATEKTSAAPPPKQPIQSAPPLNKAIQYFTGALVMYPLDSETEHLAVMGVGIKRVYDPKSMTIDATVELRSDNGKTIEEVDRFQQDKQRKQFISDKSVNGNRVWIIPDFSWNRTPNEIIFRMSSQLGNFVGREVNKGSVVEGSGVILNEKNEKTNNVFYNLYPATEFDFTKLRKSSFDNLQILQESANIQSFQAAVRGLNPVRGTCIFRSHDSDLDFDFMRFHYLPLTGTFVYERFRNDEEGQPLIFQRVGRSNFFRLQGNTQYSTGIIDVDFTFSQNKITWKGAFEGKRASDNRKETFVIDDNICAEEIRDLGEKKSSRSRKGPRLNRGAHLSLPTLHAINRTRSVKLLEEKQKLTGANGFFCSGSLRETQSGKKKHIALRLLLVPSEKLVYLLWVENKETNFFSFLKQGESSTFRNIKGPGVKGWGSLKIIGESINWQAKELEASIIVKSASMHLSEIKLKFDEKSCVVALPALGKDTLTAEKVVGNITDGAFYQSISNIMAENFDSSHFTSSATPSQKPATP